ncbi:unnamed protein product [Effrenium voratum]|uniref:Uncharacterized protein n=1 Tax=Effrenium voratum TaxID=2562239 RepID=A0AA36HUK5_9DINO|nr:unnamed protein product [Effrenium voratum]
MHDPGDTGPTQPSLASILGVEQLKQLSLGSDSEANEAKELVFRQVRQAVESLQEQLRESEPLVAELQEKADGLEEKRMLLERKAARAQRDRDIAEQDCAEVEAKVRQLREEAAPVISRFMEAEVLRSQIQVWSEDLARLQQEVALCEEELREGLPKLAELEDDEAECEGAIAQLEASHTEEVALLKSLHNQESKLPHTRSIAELRAMAMLFGDGNPIENSAELPSWAGLLKWHRKVHLSKQQEYRSLRLQGRLGQLNCNVRQTLMSVLALEGTASSRTHLHLPHFRYSYEGCRHQLYRVLAAFALQNVEVGFHKDLAVLASVFLAATDSEAQAYALLSETYHRLQMKRMLVPERDRETKGKQSLKQQVKVIIASFKYCCPATVAAIEDEGCEELLQEMLGGWLASLFCSSYSPKRQKLEEFLPLLTAAMEASTHEDPACNIREIALFMLLQNSARLMKAHEAARLQEELQDLANFLPVCRGFATALDQFQRQRKLKSQSQHQAELAAFLPVALLSGFCCLQELQLLLHSMSSAVPLCSLALTLVCADSSRTLCQGVWEFWSQPQNAEEPKGITWLELEEESGSSEAQEEDLEEEFDFEFFLGKDHPRSEILDALSPLKYEFIQLLERQDEQRIAFVTLATSEYREGALVLTAGLRSRVDADVVVFGDAEMSLVPGVHWRPLSDLPDVPVPSGEPLMPNFRFCWKKLGLWALEEYDVIIYLDADTLILGDVRSLLNFIPAQGELGAVPACECWRSESCNYTAKDADESDFYFNAGVLLLRPCKRDFLNMMDALSRRQPQAAKGPCQQAAADRLPAEMPFAEQDFLNIFFRRKVRRLPPTFNALQHALRNPKHAMPLDTCCVLHFVMGKPWARASRLEEDFAELRALWWKAHEEFAPYANVRPMWHQRRVHEKLPLFLVPGYLSAQKQASLLSTVHGMERWVELRNRRLLCLGGVPHPDGAICDVLPPVIRELGAQLVEAGGLSGLPNQCLINAYSPGQGIDAHSDGPRFESEVAIVTLEGPALMHFGLVEKKAYPALPPRLEVLLEPGSLLVIRDEAYELYVHRIDHAEVDVTREGLQVPRAPRRTSLTLRRLSHVRQRQDQTDEQWDAAQQLQWQWWNSQLSEID